VVALDAKNAVLNPEGGPYDDREQANRHHRDHTFVDGVDLAEVKIVSRITRGLKLQAKSLLFVNCKPKHHQGNRDAERGPRVAHHHYPRKRHGLQVGVQTIAPVVHEEPERARGANLPRLLAIHVVHRVVDEEADSIEEYQEPIRLSRKAFVLRVLRAGRPFDQDVGDQNEHETHYGDGVRPIS